MDGHPLFPQYSRDKLLRMLVGIRSLREMVAAGLCVTPSRELEKFGRELYRSKIDWRGLLAEMEKERQAE